MKFLCYFQLVLSLLMFVGVITLIIKEIVTGNMGLLGIPFAASIFVITGLLVLYALVEVKTYDDKDKTLRR